MHPNSLANLEKGKDTRFVAGEAQATIARKGAEAANQIRAERKAIAKYLDEFLKSPVTEEKIRAELERKGVKKKSQIYAVAVALALMGKMLKADPTALKLGLELLGEMPKDETNVNMTVSEGNQVIIYLPDDGRENAEE